MLRMLSTRHGNVLNDTIIGLSEFCPTIKRVFSYMNLVKIGFNNMPKTKYPEPIEINSSNIIVSDVSEAPLILKKYGIKPNIHFSILQSLFNNSLQGATSC